MKCPKCGSEIHPKIHKARDWNMIFVGGNHCSKCGYEEKLKDGEKP